MYQRIIWIFGPLIMVTIGGCSHAPLAKDFNESNTNNIAVQTVNPQAGKTGGPVLTLDGEKSQKALDRYRQDPGKVSSDTMLTNMKR